MPVYEYKGLDAKGKQTQGVREAEGPRTLKALLRKEGIFLTELYEEKSGEKENCKKEEPLDLWPPQRTPRSRK